MPSRRRIAIVTAILLATASSDLTSTAIAQRTEQASSTPPAVPVEPERRAIVEAVVAGIEQSFLDPEKLARLEFRKLADAAWPDIASAPSMADAVTRINRLLARLETSHTQVFTPDDPEFTILSDVFSPPASPDTWAAPPLMASGGFFTARIDGRDHVTAVLEGSPAIAADILVGDEIVSIDGAPYHPVRSLRGRAGSSVDINIRRTKDGPVEIRRVRIVTLQPSKAFDAAMQSSARVIERGGKRIGYIHVWHMIAPEALNQALARIDGSRATYRTSEGGIAAHITSDGSLVSLPLDALIVDNRVKIGGRSSVVERFLETLLGPRGGFTQQTGRDPRRRPTHAARSFKGRSVMLIDGGTRSAAELFAQGYKNEDLGPLFGTRTAGAVSGAQIKHLPGGLILYVAVQRVTINGQSLEGVGVAPTREIARPIPYSAGADPVLDSAIAHLAGN